MVVRSTVSKAIRSSVRSTLGSGSGGGAGGGGGGDPLLLDTYAGGVAAYSLRQLKTGVTNVARIRRTSDSTEQDFTAAQILDGTLATFCGAGDGCIVTLYDQSGNNYHATQATSTSQHTVVESGVLVTQNGKAVLKDTGNNDWLGTSAFGTTYAQPFSYFMVANRATGGRTFFSATSGQLRVEAFDNNMMASTVRTYTPEVTFNVWNQLQWNFNEASSGVIVNGGAQRTVNASVGISDVGGLVIAAQPTGGNAMRGFFAELILFNSIPADAAAIRQNQADFYGITLS